MNPARSEGQFLEIFNELKAQTDRGAAIIAAAIVEEALTEFLKKRLVLAGGIEKKIFSISRRGFASEFGAKIDLAFCTGLIKQETVDHLRVVAKIRNRFAHRIEPLSFADPEIKSWCCDLNTTISGRFKTTSLPEGEELETKLARLHYISVCLLHTIIFNVYSNISRLRITPVSDDQKLREEAHRIIELVAAGRAADIARKTRLTAVLWGAGGASISGSKAHTTPLPPRGTIGRIWSKAYPSSRVKVRLSRSEQPSDNRHLSSAFIDTWGYDLPL